MNRSKKNTSSPKEETGSKIKCGFSNIFNIKFDALVKAYSDSLESLNKMNSGKIDCEYGVCAATYNTRYITPKNISTFVDNLIRAIEADFFHGNMNDVNMFIVASVEKFLEENGGAPIEDSAAADKKVAINPIARTLNDIEMICINDMGPIAVYSKGEIVQRIKLMNDDLKKMNEMHFAANVKKLVSALPKVLEEAYVGPMGTCKAISKAIEDFILFALTVNTSTVLQMYAYCNPATEYSFKKIEEATEEEGKDKTITECCMCKTNDYMIRNRIPFNCNMRDVALQDVTPDFKDIHDAMHFILKDARSPICILVKKYASKDGVREIHCNDIARMFLGVSKCHEHCLSDVFKKDGEEVRVDPLDDVAGFQTHVDWLDNIAFGNNYLDGNYRRDALGNNHVHPITNSLDMIFKMYSGCDLKSNEEIADNILSIAGAMRSVVHAYREGKPIENYDLTKDVLVLLGEILTRNMLRLYYNNTNVMIYKDDMMNTMIPGFVNESFEMEEFYEESFIMEADGVDQTGANNPEAAAKPATDKSNGSVTFKDANGNEIKKPDVTGIKKILKAIADWFKKVFQAFTGKFRDEYKTYVNFVTKHAEDNKAIGEALASSGFRADLKDFAEWKIDVSKITNANIDTGFFNKILTGGEQINTRPSYVTLRMLGISENDANSILEGLSPSAENAKENAKEIRNRLYIHYFYKNGQPTTYTGPMNQTIWDEICSDITGISDVVASYVSAFSKKQEAMDDIIEKALGNAESSNNDQTKAIINSLKDCYKVAFTDLARSVTVYLANPIAKSRYTIYKATYDAYSNQKATSGTAAPAQPAENAAQPAQPEQPTT